MVSDIMQFIKNYSASISPQYMCTHNTCSLNTILPDAGWMFKVFFSPFALHLYTTED